MTKTWVGLGVMVWLAGCAAEFETGGNIGGANRNGRFPGNKPGGIAVRSGDIAVSPLGDYFLTLRGKALVLGGTQSQDAAAVDGMPTPERVAFWGEGDGFYAVSRDGGRQILVSYDRAAGRERWRKDMPERKDQRIDVTRNRVILAGKNLQILDAADGSEVATYAPANSTIRDVDVLHGGTHVLVTQETSWETGSPRTTLSVRNTDTGEEESTTDADNCADDVVVSEDETAAFLAPTLCQQDPVTVLSLAGNQISVTRQLPGFGPVAKSPAGNLLVAFLDRDAQAPEGTSIPDGVKSSQHRYHLMFINTGTLEFETQSVGDQLPRYIFTPDGKRLLVDTPMDIFSHIRVLDMTTRRWHQTSGAPAKLNTFTLSPDGRRAFIADKQLFVLDIGGAAVRPAGLSLPPDSVNLTSDGLTLLVTQVTDRVLLFFDALQTREKGRVYY
ncbi:MAG: hypothetical protein HY904_03155 [Deltaproteobacteria bacterium]|nr:hypothetical protein [Deltaproteobacteria bacterium]